MSAILVLRYWQKQCSNFFVSFCFQHRHILHNSVTISNCHEVLRKWCKQLKLKFSTGDSFLRIMLHFRKLVSHVNYQVNFLFTCMFHKYTAWPTTARNRIYPRGMYQCKSNLYIKQSSNQTQVSLKKKHLFITSPLIMTRKSILL